MNSAGFPGVVNDSEIAMKVELLTALRLYADQRDQADALSSAFSRLFADGVLLLGIRDEDVAKAFSASRPSANRWRTGKAVPASGYRRIILRELRHLTNARIAEVG